MTDELVRSSRLNILGTGAMGTAFAEAWLRSGYAVTAWNRTADRADPLAAAGAQVLRAAADAVAESGLVIVCLLDDQSVRETLAAADLAGKDVVNLTTSTPEEARTLAAWVQERGARYLDGGIMAVPPMIGVPAAGGYVLYSGPRTLFDAHVRTLTAVTGAKYVGEDAGLAALHDVALLSAMTGMFAGISHAFALTITEDIAPQEVARLLVDWLSAMAPMSHQLADQLSSGDYSSDVTSNLAMMTRANTTLLATAQEQQVTTELLTPYMHLMQRRVGEGYGAEGLAGVMSYLSTRENPLRRQAR